MRDGRVRICDILLPKQVRYQTALHPDNGSLEGNRTHLGGLEDRCPVRWTTRLLFERFWFQYYNLLNTTTAIRYLSKIVTGEQGRSRTFGVSYVTDLQSVAFATRHTCPKILVDPLGFEPRTDRL